jgi:thiol-disulfide isomerase/thioredoxin
MDTWKIAVILALIFGLGGYKYFQQRQDAVPPPPAPIVAVQADSMVGKPAPAWNIKPTQWANTPKPISLNELKGNVTLLEFWRVGCSHCRDTAPYMEKVFETFKPKGLKIVTFQSPGNSREPANPELSWPAVQSTIREWGIKYPVAFDEGAKLFKTKYHGASYPTLFLLDRNGIIRYVCAGNPIFTATREADFLKALYKVLGVPQPNSPLLLSGTPAPIATPNGNHKTGTGR